MSIQKFVSGKDLCSTLLPSGLRGSIKEIIKDCDYKKEDLVLVTRSKDFYEVHKEIKIGLLWSDPLLAMKHGSAETACKAGLKEVAGIPCDWCLPSNNEYIRADERGIMKALPRMNGKFLTSTLDRSARNSA